MEMHKRLILIAVILVVIGAVICGISFSALGSGFRSLSTATLEMNTYEVKDDFRDISIDGDEEEIRFLPSKDGRCSVVCYEEEQALHTVSVENDTLKIASPKDKGNKKNWFLHIGVWTESPTITVYLPEDEYGRLSIDSDTGDVEIPDSFRFREIKVELDTGDINCSASAEKTLALRTDTGDIAISDLRAGEVSLSTDTGDLLVSHAECDGAVSVLTDNGQTDLEALRCRDFRSVGDTGDISLKNVLVSGTFYIERNTGDVRFDGCDAESIIIKTDTGDVTGSFLTEKIIFTETDTGDVRVPKSITGGPCEITTDTGDIKITVK